MNLDPLIRDGLSRKQKQLPSALLYDDLGSMLFEAITHLPEYGVTAAGLRLLRAHCDEMVARPGPLEIVELGPGAGRKARIVVEALRKRQPGVRFIGVDVSAQALEDCARTLSEMPGVDFTAIEATYIEGLERASSLRSPGARQLVLFLGSNLSNFDRPEALTFLRQVRERLKPGDALMLATDLDKDPERLVPAYDDALGVTAAFNRNVLLHLNRQWGANFQLAAFRHEARWNAKDRRIEMHLVATRACEVSIAKLDLTVSFVQGETIWTESSHRFGVDELKRWAAEAGFTVHSQWVDAQWPFAETLLEVPPSKEQS